MRLFRFLLVVFTSAVLLCGSGAACTGTSCTPSRTAAKAEDKTDSLPAPECKELRDQILALEQRIPTRFDFIVRPVEETYKDILACSDLCRSFLEVCQGHAEEFDVSRTLARLLLTGIDFYRGELKKSGLEPQEIGGKVAARVAEIRSLSETAMAAFEPRSLKRAKAIRVLMDLHTRTGPAERVDELVRTFLEEQPTYSKKGDLFFKVAQTYLGGGRYQEAVDYLDKVIRDTETKSDYVFFNIKLFDALVGIADLQRMEELMHVIRGEYPGLLPELSGRGRHQAIQWLDVATFWLGFTSYAAGDIDEARDYFLGSREYLEKQVKELAASGKSNPVLDVYLEHRTSRHLRFLDSVQGRVPEVDFDLGAMWATDKKLTLKESRGKVVVVVFREPGTRKAVSFLQEIDSLVKEREKDGLVGATLSFLLQKEQLGNEAVLKAMRDDLKKLGVTLPAGFDPDHKAQEILRTLHATVGPTATCIVFNRRGEPVWHLTDPQNMHRQLARRVIDRVLKEK